MENSRVTAGYDASRSATNSLFGRGSSRAADAAAEPPLALLLGDVDMLAALRLAGIRAIVMAERGSPLRRSRNVVGALPPVDPWREADRLVESLIRLGERRASRLVLFYQQDSELLAISRARARLERHFDFLLPSAEMVEDLVDKSRFLALAEKFGLPVPVTIVLGPRRRKLPKRMPYPALVKPVRRDGRWEFLHGRGKAAVARSEEKLLDLWDAARRLGLSLVAQQLVAGPESAVVSYHAYVSANGRALGEFTGGKIRTRPAAFGHTTALQVINDRDVFEGGRRVRDQLGLIGVMKIDFKRAPDGRLYLLEINPRYNLWHHPGAVAGVNLPAIAYADLTGTALPLPPIARSGVRWCRWADKAAAREAGMSLFGWLRWAAACQAKSGLALSDPLPTVQLAGQRAVDALTHLARR